MKIPLPTWNVVQAMLTGISLISTTLPLLLPPPPIGDYDPFCGVIPTIIKWAASIFAIVILIAGIRQMASEFAGRSAEPLAPMILKILAGAMIVGLVAVNNGAGLVWLAHLVGWTSFTFTCAIGGGGGGTPTPTP